ncbi:UV excision repair protein Rad23 [Piedraia hortae CBS 480.64]|uniref:UV excision repair protein RAD23 n=1 Tax=Piedraia hortae CBS 480.64 TaxID=1314780 RepID=A0A6A7BT92_9PEZI|nr:UV excision repair protein Rad23 [Piedraia hortae CBS 480.64]
MQLTFKDLKQQKFNIAAEPTDTIASVKQKIKNEKGLDPALLKLIYSGKILQDDQTVESYKIEEGKGFIVCMTSKPKPPPKAEPATPAKTASTPAAPLAPAQSTASSATQQPATLSPAGTMSVATPATSSFNDPSALALGEQRAAAIANMEDMGFPRDQIDRAMRAAFNNPDRAVEYLINGIPSNVEAATSTQVRTPQTTQPQQTGQQQTESAAASGDEHVNLFDMAAQAGQNRGASDTGSHAATLGGAHQGGQSGGRPFEFLRNNQQFQQLRRAVQQNPAMLEAILQQVGAANPQLAQTIRENPEQFMSLLTEGGDDVDLPPGAHQISVTEEEREAIERLCRLGFARDQAIQAYFACDKNEELAANFLFDQPEEPDE